LKLAETMSSCGHVTKALGVYRKLLMDKGEYDKVHHEYEVFLVKYTNNIAEAEANFVKRLRFFCVPQEFLQTDEGKELQKISQRIAFLSERNEDASDRGYNCHDLHGIAINQYRKSTIYHTSNQLSLEDQWPYWLFQVHAGKLQQARALIEQWIKLVNPSSSFFFFFFLLLLLRPSLLWGDVRIRIRHVRVFKYMILYQNCICLTCLFFLKDCQKLTVRLEEFQKSIQSKAERSKLPTSFHEDYKSDSEGEDDNDDGSNNNNENDNDNANQIQRQH
ncbi:hypothetical protein RFI_06856, partial [Reticulomyxa filosa]